MDAIADYDDFCTMTDYMLATMCTCTKAEFVDKAELMFPEIYAWAMGFCMNVHEFIAAVALKYRDVFKHILSELSTGCYDFT